MKIIKVTRFLLEYFLTEGEVIRRSRIKQGIPAGCKLHSVKFEGDILTLAFKEKEDANVSPEIFDPDRVQDVAIELEAIDGA